MSRLAVCSVDAIDKEFFWEYSVILPTIILLQLLLFIHTIYFECTHKLQIKRELRVGYIALQTLGLLWTLTDLVRRIINPFFPFLYDNAGCDFTGITSKVYPILFYGTYLFQILIRLQNAFHGSFLAMHTRTVYVFAILIIADTVLGFICFFIVNDQSPCLYPWTPPDARYIAVCSLPYSPKSFLVFLITMFIVFVLNLTFGAIFSFKLNKLMRGSMADDEHMKFRMKSLIVKNGILTITGTISSVFATALWLTLSGVFLYLDVFVNALMIGLMLKYNEKYYKKICRCCIWFCFLNCDKSKSRKTEAEIRRYLEREGTLTGSSRVPTLTAASSARSAGSMSSEETSRSGHGKNEEKDGRAVVVYDDGEDMHSDVNMQRIASETDLVFPADSPPPPDLEEEHHEERAQGVDDDADDMHSDVVFVAAESPLPPVVDGQHEVKHVEETHNDAVLHASENELDHHGETKSEDPKTNTTELVVIQSNHGYAESTAL